jgi:hypothetical protein
MIYPFVLATASLSKVGFGLRDKVMLAMSSPPRFPRILCLLTRSIDKDFLPQASENR